MYREEKLQIEDVRFLIQYLQKDVGFLYSTEFKNLADRLVEIKQRLENLQTEMAHDLFRKKKQKEMENYR